MADDGKKTIVVDVTINPFGEFKGSQAPEWFKARPKLVSIVKDIKVKRSMELDPRKWKKKVLVDGVYAVARYDLALFATALNGMQKDIDKAIPPKEQKKNKFKANDKTETKEVGAALSNAEAKVTKLWKKISKSIDDKVSLALDEVESDKGDNKKAIAAGKQALKLLSRLDPTELFSWPLTRVGSVMDGLASDLKDGRGDKDKDFDAALKALRDIENDFEFNAKNMAKIAKMFLAVGEKVSKDKDADPELQSFGEELTTKGEMKSNLQMLDKNVNDMGKDLDVLVNFVAKGKATSEEVKTKGKKFGSDHKSKVGSATKAVAAIDKLADKFKKIERKLK